MAGYHEQLARIGRQMSAPLPAGTGWTPPTIGELVQRVDAALRERRAA